MNFQVELINRRNDRNRLANLICEETLACFRGHWTIAGWDIFISRRLLIAISQGNSRVSL